MNESIINVDRTEWEMQIHDLRWFNSSGGSEQPVEELFDPVDGTILFKDNENSEKNLELHVHTNVIPFKSAQTLSTIVNVDESQIREILSKRFPGKEVTYDIYDEMFTVADTAIVTVKPVAL